MLWSCFWNTSLTRRGREKWKKHFGIGWVKRLFEDVKEPFHSVGGVYLRCCTTPRFSKTRMFATCQPGFFVIEPTETLLGCYWLEPVPQKHLGPYLIHNFLRLVRGNSQSSFLNMIAQSRYIMYHLQSFDMPQETTSINDWFVVKTGAWKP